MTTPVQPAAGYQVVMTNTSTFVGEGQARFAIYRLFTRPYQGREMIARGFTTWEAACAFTQARAKAYRARARAARAA
jgi:hypothetical protein